MPVHAYIPAIKICPLIPGQKKLKNKIKNKIKRILLEANSAVVRSGRFFKKDVLVQSNSEIIFHNRKHLHLKPPLQGVYWEEEEEEEIYLMD